MTDRWKLCIVAVAAMAFLLKLTLALRTYGTNDVLFWEANLVKIRHDGALALYRDGATLYHDGSAQPYYTEPFNQPPFVTRVLLIWGWLADVSGLPLRFWLRLTSSAADVLNLALVVAILRRAYLPAHPVLLLLMATAPISLLVSGFHGNTDPLMMAFVLGALFLLVAGGPAWAVGATLGMAMNIKIVPAIFIPAVCFCLGDAKKQAQVLAGAAAVFVLGSLPFLIQEPRLIWERVFEYRPYFGIWGLTRFASVLLPRAVWETYARYSRPVVLAVVLASSLWMNARPKKPAAPLQFGLLSFLFLATSPAFGVQYLAWLVPWTALLTIPEAVAFHISSAALLFAFYNQLAGGMPWYLASVLERPAWAGAPLIWGVLCWAVVALVTASFVRRMASEKKCTL